MSLPANRVLGLIAAGATVTIWAGFMLITRFAVNSSFTVEEILFLRLVPGAIALTTWRDGQRFLVILRS